MGSTEQATQSDAPHLQACCNAAISRQLGAANAVKAVSVVQADTHKRARQDAGAQKRRRSCRTLVACRVCAVIWQQLSGWRTAACTRWG